MRISDWSSDVCSSDLVAADPADELVDIAALARGEEGERRAGKSVGNGQVDVAADRLVDDREVIGRIAGGDPGDRRELVFDQADTRQVLGGRLAVDLAAVRRPDGLIGTGGLRDQQNGNAYQGSARAKTEEQ